MKSGEVRAAEVARHPSQRLDAEYWLTPPCKLGDRVRLTAPLTNPDSTAIPVEQLPVGSEGTVDWVGQWTNELTRQLGVKWDNGSRLILLEIDRGKFEVIEPFVDPTGFPCELDNLDDGGGEILAW